MIDIYCSSLYTFPMAQGVKKGSIYSLIGQGGAAFFVFLFQAIAARMLGTSRFGLLSLLYSLILTFSTILSSGVRDTLIRNISFFDDSGEERKLKYAFRNALYIFSIFIGIFISFTIIFLRPISTRLFDGKVILLFEFLIGAFLIANFRVFSSIIEGHREFHLFSFFLVLQSFFLFIGVLLGLLFNRTVVSTGLGLSLSPIIPLSLLFFLIAKKRWFYTGGEVSPIERIRIFIIEISILNFLDIFLLRFGPLLIKVFGGINANYYNGLYSAIFMPLNFTRTLMIALFISIFPNIARAFGRKDKNLIRRYVSKGMALVIGTVIIVTIIFYLWGPLIVRIIYGKGYIVNRVDCVLISLIMGFYLLGRLNNRILIAGGKYRISLFSLIGALVITIILSLLLKIPIMLRVEFSLLFGSLFYAITQVYFIIFKSKFF